MSRYKLIESWDWSGAGAARSRRAGLARSTWNSVSNSIDGDSRYSRDQVLDRLQGYARRAASWDEVLVALDFPFSFPFIAKGNQFLDRSNSWFDFSTSIYEAIHPSGVASLFYGSHTTYGSGTYADHFAHLNRGAGIIGPSYIEAYRQTESNARLLGCSAACTFRLVNPMVGVQAIAGIYTLRRLLNWCGDQQLPLTIWPLGHLDRRGQWSPGQVNWSDSGLVVIESYPNLSYYRAGIPRRALTSLHAVGQAIVNLGCVVPAGAIAFAPQSDDEQDALIVLLHLLSPDWYRAQIEPSFTLGQAHIDGHFPETPAQHVVSPQVFAPLLEKEGNIYGV